MIRRQWASVALSFMALSFISGVSIASGQTSAPANPFVAPTPTKAPTATDAMVLDAASLAAVIGRSVKSSTGEDMGRIVDMLVPLSGHVRAAVIDFGGFLGVGSRRIAVDWAALDFGDVAKSGNIIVALTRNQVRMAPEYKQGDPIVLLEALKPDRSRPDVSGPAAGAGEARTPQQKPDDQKP